MTLLYEELGISHHLFAWNNKFKVKSSMYYCCHIFPKISGLMGQNRFARPSYPMQCAYPFTTYANAICNVFTMKISKRHSMEHPYMALPMNKLKQ